jgi:double-strand break repair protein MRE11
MSLLREYTLGDKPVQIELLSDPSEGKAAGFSYAKLPLFDNSLSQYI